MNFDREPGSGRANLKPMRGVQGQGVKIQLFSASQAAKTAKPPSTVLSTA